MKTMHTEAEARRGTRQRSCLCGAQWRRMVTHSGTIATAVCSGANVELVKFAAAVDGVSTPNRRASIDRLFHPDFHSRVRNASLISEAQFVDKHIGVTRDQSMTEQCSRGKHAGDSMPSP